MTLTTSTTHGTSTITASLDTETLRVSLDVDGIDAGSGRWVCGAISDCGAQLAGDDIDATEAVYSALDSGLRAQLAAQSPAAQCPTLDSLLASMRCGALSACDADWNDLPSYGGATPRDTTQVWSWDETRLLVGDCSDNLEIVDRVNCTWTR